MTEPSTQQQETSKTEEELRELRKQFHAGVRWCDWPDGVTNGDLAAALALPDREDD